MTLEKLQQELEKFGIKPDRIEKGRLDYRYTPENTVRIQTRTQDQEMMVTDFSERTYEIRSKTQTNSFEIAALVVRSCRDYKILIP